ncbi:concanavalin A-like lectin/glucanase domain-containing protein [Mycena sp. CBHHK59/15]|nr:concanavalin A-like lectin/glucanase domain-containing protein [Mycena sp. CBHHK59/15]
MVVVGSLLVLLAAAAAGVSQTLNITDVDSAGFYYSFWAEDGANITLSGYGWYYPGLYNIQWSENARFLGGKGWSAGSAQEIQFWSDHSQTGGNSLLSLYGWTTDPLVEYHITEDFSTPDRFADLALKGTVTSDGSVYNIYEAKRVNETSILGITTFSQYWSVRQSPRSSGFLTTENHFNAWAALGMPLGEFNYQIFAVESYSGSGSVDVKVSHVSFLGLEFLCHVFSLSHAEPSACRSTDNAAD